MVSFEFLSGVVFGFGVGIGAFTIIWAARKYIVAKAVALLKK